MTTTLLATKLYIPPVRAGLVARSRLIELLDEGHRLGHRLTLVSAPAGFGKTTLVSAWVQQVGGATPNLHVAWISLDEGDNDPARFFTYLITALQGVEPLVGQAVQDLLRVPQLPPTESLVTALINDIAATSSPLVLVLDDYHAITALAIHEAVGLLLERQPPQMHLVIVTRQDPSLPLSRFRARGQMTEIRESDLRFTVKEAATFLNQSIGLELTESEIATLQGRTEGWAAGLQLAGLSMQGRDAEGASRFIAGFSGRHPFILDYLTEEILQRQPEPVRAFLLQTSILERMCGPLCDALLEEGQEALDDGRKAEFGQPSRGEEAPLFVPRHSSPSQAMLEALERANLFLVPLDEERRWYRYHRLFADLLRAWLQETQPERLPELHRRAAMWFEENLFASESIAHALASQDFDLAAGMIDRGARKVTTWSRIDGTTLLKWLDALPEDAMRSRPRLRLYASRALYTTGQWEAARQSLQELESWLEDNPGVPDAEAVWELLVADRASYAAARGEVSRAKEYACKALARLPHDDRLGHLRPKSVLGLASQRSGNVVEASRAFSEIIAVFTAEGISFAAVPLVCNLADVQTVQGRLREARQTYERAMEMGIVDGSPTAVTGFVGLGLSKILYEQNDLEAAETHVSEGLEALRRGGISTAFGVGHALLAQIKQARGDSPGAQAAAQHAVWLAESSSIPRLAILASAYQARIWLARDEVERAAQWAREYRQIGSTEYLRETEDLTLARVLLATGRPSEALSLLDDLLSPAETAGRMGPVIEIQVLRALALQPLGDIDGALDALEGALRLAEPEGYVRVFLDGGQPTARLLRRAAAQRIRPRYVRELLDAFPVREMGKSDEDQASALIEPLTGREKEVLKLLAEGLTNAEIGQRLYISLPTVKSHTRNIYGKLGVHSRREAVVQARDLAILPPHS